MDRGEEPFIKAWGTNSAPRWSPDGKQIAFVSERVDHSFIGIYDVATRTVKYMAPSVDRDTSPTWSHDGKRIAFIRRPGLPFGQQAQQGGGGMGVPTGPAFNPAAQGGRGAQQGRGGAGRVAAGAADVARRSRNRQRPGADSRSHARDVPRRLHAVDVGRRSGTGEASEFWHTTPDERVFTNINAIQWAGDHVLFTVTVPNDQWERYFSLPLAGPATATPTLLTTTNGLIEDATSVTLSKDGRTLYYTTNHGDIDRRHVWAVPTAGGTPKQVSTGDGHRNVTR